MLNHKQIYSNFYIVCSYNTCTVFKINNKVIFYNIIPLFSKNALNWPKEVMMIIIVMLQKFKNVQKITITIFTRIIKFVEHQISIWNAAINKLHIEIYENNRDRNSYFISQYYSFYCISYSENANLVNRRHFFQKHLTDPIHTWCNYYKTY